MKWLIVALLLFPNGYENVISNEELLFSDEKSSREYIMTNDNLLHHGINVYLNSMFGYNNEIKIQSVNCEEQNDEEKEQMNEYLNNLVE